jgi:hypothetical protein
MALFAAADMKKAFKKVSEAGGIAGIAGHAQNPTNLASLQVWKVANLAKIANTVIGKGEGMITIHARKKHGVVVLDPNPKPVSIHCNRVFFLRSNHLKDETTPTPPVPKPSGSTSTRKNPLIQPSTVDPSTSQFTFTTDILESKFSFSTDVWEW